MLLTLGCDRSNANGANRLSNSAEDDQAAPSQPQGETHVVIDLEEGCTAHAALAQADNVVISCSSGGPRGVPAELGAALRASRVRVLSATDVDLRISPVVSFVPTGISKLALVGVVAGEALDLSELAKLKELSLGLLNPCRVVLPPLLQELRWDLSLTRDSSLVQESLVALEGVRRLVALELVLPQLVNAGHRAALRSLQALPHLESLHVTEFVTNGSEPWSTGASLAMLPESIVHLDISATALGADEIASLTDKLQQLRALTLRSSSFGLPTVFECIGDTTLDTLHLVGNADEPLRSPVRLQSLRTLAFSVGQGFSASVDSLYDIVPNVEVLSLTTRDVQRIGTLVANLAALKKLTLIGAAIERVDSDVIATLSIRELHLIGCDLSADAFAGDPPMALQHLLLDAREGEIACSFRALGRSDSLKSVTVRGGGADPSSLPAKLKAELPDVVIRVE